MTRALLLLALLASGCVTVRWTRNYQFLPPDEEALAALEPGSANLGDCLTSLGAPLFVEEHGRGVAIA